ncbi:hypothetical protein E2320_000871 [Naja naja]|nr:hypothetical protein E2320_000871 [Naja naja]
MSFGGATIKAEPRREDHLLLQGGLGKREAFEVGREGNKVPRRKCMFFSCLSLGCQDLQRSCCGQEI